MDWRPELRNASWRKGKHVIIAVILIVTFLAGALAGVLVLMWAGMNRERDRFLSNEAPTRIAAAARFVSGLCVHMPDRAAHADLCHDRHRPAAPADGRHEVRTAPAGNGEPK